MGHYNYETSTSGDVFTIDDESALSIQLDIIDSEISLIFKGEDN